MHQMRISEKLGYGVGDYALNLFFQGAGLYLLYFYTDVAKIPAATAGLIYAIALIWDGISDPMMGYYAHKTKTKYGKYRPYLLYASVPLAISFSALFYLPDSSPTWILVYAIITHLLFRTVYTVVSIPYGALSAELTQNAAERSTLTAFRMFFAVLGGLTVAICTKPLVKYFGGADESAGFLAITFIYGMIAVLLLAIAFYTTSEKVKPTNEVQPSLADVVRMLKQNIPFWLIVGVALFISASFTLTTKTLVYYFKYNLQAEDKQGLGLLSILGVALIAIPLWAFIGRWIGKKGIFLGGAIISFIAYTGMFLLDGQSLGMLLFMLLFLGIGLAGNLLAFWACLPDTVEYGEWKTGVRAEGMVFGLASFFQKTSLGLAAFLVGMVLENTGYVPNTTQTPTALWGISFLFTVLPVLMLVLGAAFMYFYPLTGKQHAQIVKEINERKQASQ